VTTLGRIAAYPINDVSTDVDAPPPLDGRDGSPAGGPPMSPERREKCRRAYPELLGGLTLELSAGRALALAEAAARAQPGWTVRRVDATAGLVTAVAVTPLIHFRDDVTVRVRASGGRTRVDVRSRSRLGRDDLGANAGRIRRYLRALEVAAAARR
jgi:hypothetical protein